jgi:dTDP-alpha-D-glucuronic acid decarboxylase
MAQVLVTGGCGFIGSHVAGHLARSGDEVTVFDAAPPPRERAESVRYIQGDVRDEAALARSVPGGVDVIYHLSAVVGVDRYLAVPADVVEINLLGTLNLLRRARAADAKIVLASTSEVYGKNPDPPWHEDSDRVLGSTAVDRWSYATSKALAEHLAFAYIRQYGVRATIVRFFNVYGPRQRPAYVVSRSIHRALRGLAPEVYDGGAQTRCFTYIDDAVRGTELAAKSAKADGEHFNIGSDRETTVAEVVDIVCELTGLPVPAAPLDTEVQFGPRYQDIGRRVPDTSKAREVLGWECATSLRDGLAMTIDWARRNPWWLEQLDDESPASRSQQATR